MNSASSPGTVGKRPSCQLRLASPIRAFESSCGLANISIRPRSAASDGAVDDVGGSRAASGASSIHHIDARDISKDAATSEVGCSDLSEVTVKQHCCLETALP
jgi:hypothetical protein